MDDDIVGRVRKSNPRAKVVVFNHRMGWASQNFKLEYPADGLVVSHSTITSAMHLAAYMGAATVILAGHDCGALDGQLNFAGCERRPRTRMHARRAASAHTSVCSRRRPHRGFARRRMACAQGQGDAHC